MSNSVLVLTSTKKPLMPCHPARARELLRKGKAAVFRQQPFTIILKDREDGVVQETELKIDLGSKTTGMAIVSKQEKGNKCLFGLNLQHRGQQIRDALLKRSQQRRSRRQRKTRYRPARFNNRTKPKGWLTPSVQHRVTTAETWIKRFIHWVPIHSVVIETVKFDIQKMMNPDIQGKEYQQGELFQFELKEYLLYKHNHTCQYCHGLRNDKILQLEHIVPKSRGGTNRLSNLTIACKTCNLRKSNFYLDEWIIFLKSSKNLLDKKIATIVEKFDNKKSKTFKDASVMNAIRYRLGNFCKSINIPVTYASGFITKFNRSKQNYRKDHWIDAACVGSSGKSVYISKNHSCLTVRSMGHGSRQMCLSDKYGFPRTKAKSCSSIFGFKTGDLVKAISVKGKYIGTYVGRIAVRECGWFNINVNSNIKIVSYKACVKAQSNDGFSYLYGTIINKKFIISKNDNIKNYFIKCKKCIINSVKPIFEGNIYELLFII